MSLPSSALTEPLQGPSTGCAMRAASAAPCSSGSRVAAGCSSCARPAALLWASRRRPRPAASRLAVHAAAAEVEAEELSEDAKIAKLLAKPYKCEWGMGHTQQAEPCPLPVLRRLPTCLPNRVSVISPVAVCCCMVADGFKTIIESDVFPKGLSEDVVRAISAKKEEPEWMLEFRCAAKPGTALWEMAWMAWLLQHTG